MSNHQLYLIRRSWARLEYFAWQGLGLLADRELAHLLELMSVTGKVAEA